MMDTQAQHPDWTRERIYTQPDRKIIRLSQTEPARRLPLPLVPTISLRSIDHENDLTREFKAVVKSETTWALVHDGASTGAEIYAAIDAGKPCPRCSDSRSYSGVARGGTTGVVIRQNYRCPCGARRIFLLEIEQLGPRFRSTRLSILTPSMESKLPVARQDSIIKDIRSQKTDSFLFCGRPGTGKTYMAATLFTSAVWRAVKQQWNDTGHYERCVWWANCRALMAELTDWEMKRHEAGGVVVPSITEAKIRKAVSKGHRPALFLDELDRISKTDFRINSLLSVISAVYDSKDGEGQVVATSNKSYNELKEVWGNSDAEATVRRIGEGAGRHIIAF